MQYIEDGEISIAIDLDQGARISSLLFREHELTVPFRGGLTNWGCFSMAPWAGRIRDGIVIDGAGNEFQLPVNLDPPHALHGFGLLDGWQELGKGATRLELPYPYLGASVEQRIEVLDNALRWSLQYDGGKCELPAWVGLHPWFTRELDTGDLAELEFSAGKMLERGSDGMPTGALISPSSGPWDDAFTQMQGVPKISWGNTLQLSIESDAPWWVIYNEDSDGICVEPQSAPPDAANLGISGDHYIEALFIFDTF